MAQPPRSSTFRSSGNERWNSPSAGARGRTLVVDRRIIEEPLRRATDVARQVHKRVAHYTRLETLLHILGPGGVKSLRATGIRYLNDRNELTHGLRILNEDPESEKFKSAFAQIENASPDVYQVSFSGAPDELGQWRGYA